MCKEKTVLCGANSYEQKFYLNNEFGKLPESIKDELQIMCVMFTEEIGGIIILEFDGDGSLQIDVRTEEGDLLFDEIGCGLKVKQMQQEKRELFEALEMYYRVFYLGMEVEE